MAVKTKTKTKPKKKPKSKAGLSDKSKIIITVSTILTVFIVFLISVMLVASSARSSSKELVKLNKDVAYGIDVSHHNGDIDWKAVKNEVDFAFIRVGYRGYTDGEIHSDTRAKYNLNHATKNNIPIGVYFYSQATNEDEAKEEAEFLLKRIKGYDISLPVVIDFEYPYKDGKPVGRLNDANLSKREITNIINEFCDEVEDAGYTPAVYASSYIFKYHINMNKLDDDIMIWVADYNKEVTYGGEYDFWQFSEKGKCEGVSSKYVDTNYWYINKEDNN